MKRLFIVLLLLTLSACSIDVNTPHHAVEQALSALKEKDTDTFNHYSNSTLYSYILDVTNFYPQHELTDNENNFYQSLVPYIQAFEYEIIDVDTIYKTAYVTVNFTHYDIAQCLQDIQNEVLRKCKDYNATTMDEYYTYLTETFLNNIENYFTLTNQKEIEVNRKNHQWRLAIDDPSAFIYYLYVQTEE